MTAQQSETFINEYGNEILIVVHPKNIPNVCVGDSEGTVPGIMMEITGPASASDNLVTRMEAERLWLLLGRALDKI